ncbi:MAG TPA: RHS repeat-associated core domain-containing protein [Candidatus Limnocylindrales bacterium]|nr:RHS repeat-associated core domain-containing protein [Candidatus Limnocylindrales bacterium]
MDDDVTSTFAYDVLGELTGYCPAVQAAGSCDPSSGSEVKAWHYEYDDLGRQTRTIPPVNQYVTALTTEETVYEDGGRVAKTCRYPAGTSCGATNSRHVDFTYDDLGRITEQKTYDRGAGSDTLKFTKTLTWNADGAPDTVNEGSDTLTYAYDTAGRLSQLKRGATVLTEYTYTPATSTIATRTDGTAGATTFSYDWARRSTTVDPPDTFVAGTVTRTYRLDGLLQSQSFPASITETLAYDAAKRPLSISLGAAGSISQAFDRGGNVISDGRSLAGISGDAGGNSQAFTYDGLSRLLSSTGLASSSGSYEYDLDGNRVKRVEGGSTTTFSYDRADQTREQVIAGTTRTFSYDPYGNLLQSADKTSALTTYAYDEASRLTAITPPSGGAISFTIDALDRHKDRSVGGVATDTYHYLDTTETAWQTGEGTPTSALLDVDGSRLAVKTGGSVSWLLFDLHGSVVALCPAGSSTLSDAYRFDGWGQQVASAGTAVNPWRYRGLLNIGSDALTGALLDMNARDYSPQLGTFTQQDSVQGSAANPASMNRFLYAHANPATLIDPDGHMVQSVYQEPYYPDTRTDQPCHETTCGGTVIRPRSTRTSMSTSTQTRDRMEGHTVSIDCGFERLGCRSDWIASSAGLGMGLGQSGWDLVGGVWDLGATALQDARCSLAPDCARQRLLAQLANAGTFWSNPGAGVGSGIDGVAAGIRTGLEDLDRSIFHARSGFEGWRSAAHATGTVALTVAPGIAALRALRAARFGSGAASATAATSTAEARMPLASEFIRDIGRATNPEALAALGSGQWIKRATAPGFGALGKAEVHAYIDDLTQIVASYGAKTKLRAVGADDLQALQTALDDIWIIGLRGMLGQ